MGDTRARELAVNESFANFKDPAGSTLDILGSIQSMMKFYEKEQPEYKRLQALGRTETKFLNAGILALQNSPMLQEKLGTGFTAASTVADLLKKRTAESIYNATLDNALQTPHAAVHGRGRNCSECVALRTAARTAGESECDPLVAVYRRGGARVH